MASHQYPFVRGGQGAVTTIFQQIDLRKADGNPDGVVEGCELGIEDGEDVGSSLPLWIKKDTGHSNLIVGASIPPHLGSGQSDDTAHILDLVSSFLYS